MLLSTLQKPRPTVVDAGRSEIWFSLERLAHVHDLIRPTVLDFYNRQNELVRRVQGAKDFIAGDRHGVSTNHPALHLDEPQRLVRGNRGFDVVAYFGRAHVTRRVTEPSLHR